MRLLLIQAVKPKESGQDKHLNLEIFLITEQSQKGHRFLIRMCVLMLDTEQLSPLNSVTDISDAAAAQKSAHYTVLFLLKLDVGVPLNTLSVSITVSYCTSRHVN